MARSTLVTLQRRFEEAERVATEGVYRAADLCRARDRAAARLFDHAIALGGSVEQARELVDRAGRRIRLEVIRTQQGTVRAERDSDPDGTEERT